MNANNQEKGSVLIIVLIVLISLATFSVAFFVTSNNNLLIAHNEIRKEKLYFAAETGARLALKKYMEEYKKETESVKIESYIEVYNNLELTPLVSGTLTYENGEHYNYYGEYKSESSQVQILGKGELNKNGKSYIKRVLINLKIINE